MLLPAGPENTEMPETQVFWAGLSIKEFRGIFFSVGLFE